MSFVPPPGPPPPSAPDGWKPQFDDRYKQWYFVNLHTGKSQWEPPTGPALPNEQHAPPRGPPPSYEQSGPANPTAAASAGDIKRPLSSNNPYNNHSGTSSVDDDARLAARLQAEEDARAGRKSPAASRGAAAEFYNEAPQPQGGYPPSSSQSPAPPSLPQREQKSRGFLGKLFGQSSGSQAGYASSRPPQYGYQGYPQGGYPGGYGGYPPQQPMGYGYPPQGGYYPPQQVPPPPRKSGLGTGAAAALGVGGGLIGGALLADAFEDHEQDVYDAGYDNGYDDGGDFGGDF